MKNDDESAPDDLPAPVGSTAGLKPIEAVEAARTCEKCGSKNVRIFSNYNGRQAKCTECKHWWSIAMVPAAAIVRGDLNVRGLSKRTVIEPDWNLAYEDLDDVYDPNNDPTKNR